MSFIIFISVYRFSSSQPLTFASDYVKLIHIFLFYLEDFPTVLEVHKRKLFLILLYGGLPFKQPFKLIAHVWFGNIGKGRCSSHKWII